MAARPNPATVVEPSGTIAQAAAAAIDDAVAALTPRGQRTRATLVEGAARVFARDGFIDARIVDITAEARVANGTFYTYFKSKEDVFKEVILHVQRDMSESDEGVPPASGTDIWDRVEHSNRRYVRAYRRNAKLMATLEQVATFDDDVRRLRLDLRRLFVERNARAIARWQKAGLADRGLDPRYAANALGTMVDRFAYTWFVLGEEFDEDIAVETLTRLWVQAIGVEHGRRPARQARRSRS